MSQATITNVTSLKCLEIYRGEKNSFSQRELDEHLVDLAERIVTALDVFPKPARKAGNRPSENTSPGDTEPAAAAGAADSTPQPRKSPPSSARPKSRKKPRASALGVELGQWMEREKVTIAVAAKKIGISQLAVQRLLDGTTRKPHAKTRKLVRDVIWGTKAKKKPRPNAGNGSQAPVMGIAMATGPGTFLKGKVDKWMAYYGLGITTAAQTLNVERDQVSMALRGFIPSDKTLKQLATVIPEVAASMDVLVSARGSHPNDAHAGGGRNP